jgi:hypothetical protein
MKTAPSFFARRAPLAAIIAASLTMSGSAALAQDGTGAATPTPPSACEIVPATTTGGATSATPQTAPAESPAATPATGSGNIPVVFVGASPEADSEAEETETSAADPLTQDLEAASTAIAGCLSDGQYETLVRITGDTYRGQLIGFGAPLSAGEFTLVAPMLPQVPYQIISVENATSTSDTTATAEVTYELAHQLRLSTWEFELQEIDGQDVWTLQSETPMAPVAPQNTDTLTVEIGEGGYTIADATVQGPSVAIEASNTDDVDHEVLVLRLASGATTDDLLTNTEPTLPEGVTYIGQATVPAGSQGTLLLSGLQPGTYTIVDLLPNAAGLPNLSDGMEITFTVE